MEETSNFFPPNFVNAVFQFLDKFNKGWKEGRKKEKEKRKRRVKERRNEAKNEGRNKERGNWFVGMKLVVGAGSLGGSGWICCLTVCYFLLSPQISVLCPHPHFELVVLLTISVKNKAIRGVLSQITS